jgi:MFS family permease
VNLAAALIAFAVVFPAELPDKSLFASAGLLIVGLAAAPVVPSALSLAGRAAPDRSGQAVAVTTAAGYSAFIASPVLVGGFAQATGLRAAMAALVLVPITIAVLGTRWPELDSK